MGKNKITKRSSTENLPAENKTFPLKTIDEITNFVEQYGVNLYSRNVILGKVKEELNKTKSLEKSLENFTADSSIFQALTLFEFDKAVLGTLAIYEEYRAFFVDFMHKLQKEYQCQSTSEKSLCQLAALSYVRMLESQRIITHIQSRGEIDEKDTRIIAVMGKEVDRASRQYLTALQMLQTMKQPTLNVNIKTQTAVVGQNQIVQTNNK